LLKSVLGQISKFLNQGYAFAAATPRRLADEGLVWVVAHVHFKLLQLIRQQEAVWHEVVLTLEETLQS